MTGPSTTQPAPSERPVVMIGSPLETEQVARIAAAFGDRIDLIYRPDLLPPVRYQNDHNGPADWRRSPEQQTEWRELLATAEVLWDFPVKENVPTLEIAPRLRWMQTSSAGVGQRVKQLGFQDSDVLVTTASGVHARPLTEFVFAALLYHTKNLALLQRQQRDHDWTRISTGTLNGQTMAILGPGRIGREVARTAAAFGMSVWAMANSHDPARAGELGADRLFARNELHEMLAGADCVVLVLPHTPDTEDIIGRAEIAAMKPGAVLVNIARGVVIDEAAMIEALQSGRIGFAALDVFRTEPLPADSPLWDLPNVLINSHSASTAAAENTLLTDRFIANLGHYLNGEIDQMGPVLDKQRLY